MAREFTLRAETLTADAFAPFGTVIEQPPAAQDAGGPGWHWWGDRSLLHSDGRPYMVGYLTLEPGELAFDWAERHMRSPELLAPTDDCLLYVGAPDFPEQPDRMPPLEELRVFHVRKGQAVLLDKGVWHGPPLAIDRPLNVFVLLLQGTGANDLTIVRFGDTPVQIGLE